MAKWLMSVGIMATFCATAGAASALTPTRYIDDNGVRLAVYESSGHRGPGVLLVHGNTSAANSFGRVLDSAFARRHHVVAVDLAGYGNSDNAPAYNTAYFAQQIQHVAQATGTDDGVIVGWSLGGDLALQAAPLLPHAQGYFLFGTAPLGYTPTLPPAFLDPTQSYAGSAVFYGFIPTLTNAQIDDYVTAFFRPQYRNIPSFFFADGYRTDPATRAAVGLAGAGLDPTFRDEVAVAQGLSVPIALVLGTKDAFVNPAYMTALAPTIPTLWTGDIVDVKYAGHAIQWEDPLRFNLLLAAFYLHATHCD